MANLLKLPPWSADRSLHVVIETPRGSAVKVKLDADLRVFTIARPLPEGMVYPFDFGFVPGTRAEDGDPLDAVVYWDVATWKDAERLVTRHALRRHRQR